MNFQILNQFALALEADGTYTPLSPDAWAFAGQMALLGIGMIFSVLAILWGVLAIFKLVFAGRSPKEPKPQKVKEAKYTKKAVSASKTDDDVIAAVIAASIRAAQEDEAALVAVLSAAVAEYRAAEGNDGGFRVVSFKRASAGRGWNTRK